MTGTAGVPPAMSAQRENSFIKTRRATNAQTDRHNWDRGRLARNERAARKLFY